MEDGREALDPLSLHAQLFRQRGNNVMCQQSEVDIKGGLAMDPSQMLVESGKFGSEVVAVAHEAMPHGATCLADIFLPTDHTGKTIHDPLRQTVERQINCIQHPSDVRTHKRVPSKGGTSEAQRAAAAGSL